MTLLLAVAFVVAPIALGVFFVLITLVSATELRLDPGTGWAERRLFGPIINKSDRFRLSELPEPEVYVRDTEDGDQPILRLRLPGGRWKLDMACFASRGEAELWRDRIAQITGR